MLVWVEIMCDMSVVSPVADVSGERDANDQVMRFNIMFTMYLQFFAVHLQIYVVNERR